MLTIYHAPGSRSVRVVWLCHELGLEFEVVTADELVRQSDLFRQISPGGKVPALVDDGIVMLESGAIMYYLLERYGDGKLQPRSDPQAFADYHQWCWFAEATLIRPLGLYRVLRASDGGDTSLAEEAKQKFRDALAMVEDALVDKSYLLGDDFTAADIMMGYSLAMAEPLLSDRYPNVVSYLGRLKRRAALLKAFELG